MSHHGSVQLSKQFSAVPVQGIWLGLKLGDDITVNGLGRDVTARIGSLRTVDWQSLGINFVLVYSPNTFAGAPHTDIATLTQRDASVAGDAKLIKAVAGAFPMVTSVRVREALDSIGAVVGNLVLAIRGASTVTLLSAILVLGGALAAGHRHRVYDAVILKTLGATRARLIGAYGLEYLMIGLATAAFGVAAARAGVLRECRHREGRCDREGQGVERRAGGVVGGVHHFSCRQLVGFRSRRSTASGRTCPEARRAVRDQPRQRKISRVAVNAGE